MKFITAILWSEYLKKAACLFAGLGHLQPLLLATTNSHYLLDRFCMERCCSSEYISRIVTSIIFMEILSIILVRIVLYIGIGKFKDWSGAQQLVEHTRKEEEIRDFVSILILCLITLGYFHILLAFLSGGKKGHMHWFYASLLIQHFLNSLIAGSIGFWEVGLALWYLVTLPMAPIIIFFYQLIIHSWIRNNGPCNIEYLVVECQIWLAFFLSVIATVSWTAGYVLPHIPDKEAQLNLTTPNTGSITAKEDSRALNIYSTTGVTAEANTKTLKIFATSGTVAVRVYSIKVTLSGNADPVIVYPGIKLTSGQTGAGATVTAKHANPNVTITITTGAKTLWSKDVTVKDVPGATGINKMYLALDSTAITVKDATKGEGGQAITVEPAEPVTVTGYTCYPHNGYYIYGISGTTSDGNNVIGNLWNSTWAGGKCFYAEYYKNNSGTSSALLKLCILGGGSPGIKYYGTKDGIAS